MWMSITERLLLFYGLLVAKRVGFLSQSVRKLEQVDWIIAREEAGFECFDLYFQFTAFYFSFETFNGLWCKNFKCCTEVVIEGVEHSVEVSAIEEVVPGGGPYKCW